MATSGIWIPIEILHNDDLTPTEKMLLSEVSQLTKLDDGCIASNNHLSWLLNITRQSASKAVSSLTKKGYITTEIVPGSRNHSRVINLTTPSIKTLNPLASKRYKTKGKEHNKEHSAITLKEIEAYITEKKLNVNGKSFYEYFEAGNWVDSKGNKVKNWKQKILTWNNHSKPITAKKKVVLI